MTWETWNIVGAQNIRNELLRVIYRDVSNFVCTKGKFELCVEIIYSMYYKSMFFYRLINKP